MLRGPSDSEQHYSLTKTDFHMTTLTNPFEIARETLRLLATRRIPPTPDNYLTLYHEISGTHPSKEAFPEKQLRALAAALPKSTPEQLRLARQLEESVKAGNWDDFRDHLAQFVSALAEAQKLAWSELISNLIRQWDAKHVGLTAARKRESLDHVLAGAGANPETLFNRLQGFHHRELFYGFKHLATPTQASGVNQFELLAVALKRHRNRITRGTRHVEGYQALLT